MGGEKRNFAISGGIVWLLSADLAFAHPSPASSFLFSSTRYRPAGAGCKGPFA
jgi:hypothetical protein